MLHEPTFVNIGTIKSDRDQIEGCGFERARRHIPTPVTTIIFEKQWRIDHDGVGPLCELGGRHLREEVRG